MGARLVGAEMFIRASPASPWILQIPFRADSPDAGRYGGGKGRGRGQCPALAPGDPRGSGSYTNPTPTTINPVNITGGAFKVKTKKHMVLP